MFKVNNKDTSTMSLALFWCLYCTPSSSSTACIAAMPLAWIFLKYEWILSPTKIKSLVIFNKKLTFKFTLVGNKAKGQISKRVFQENKARQVFRRTNISYPLMRTRTYAYQRVRNVRFSENLARFVFLKHPFWDSPFCLIIDEFRDCQWLTHCQRFLLQNRKILTMSWAWNV